jgi:hypothetical protein
MITVEYADIKNDTPALARRKERKILVNKNVFPDLPEQQQRFIIEHESGHIHLNTSNENLVDQFASREMLGTVQGSLKGSLKAISENLDIKNNPEHQKRYLDQLERSAKYDLTVNGNKKANKILKAIQDMKISNTSNNQISMSGSAGFVWGFGATVFLIILIVVLYLYLTKGKLF